MDEIDSAIKSLERNVNSIRDFIGTYSSYIEKIREDMGDEFEEDIDPIMEKVSTGLHEDKDKIDEKYEKDEKDEVIYIDSVDQEGGQREVRFAVEEEYREPFEYVIREMQRTSERLKLLYNGSLMNLTSHIEVFFSDLLHAYFNTFPDALGSDETIFSLNDLESFDTIEDAKNAYISSRVDNIMDGPFLTWTKYLSNNFNMSMSYLDNNKNKETIEETFQRRNLVVHAGGVINRQYLSKVDDQVKGDIDVGEKLGVNYKYLIDRIDIAERICILIGLEMWKNIGRNNQDRFETIDNICHRALLDENYDLVRNLSFFAKEDGCFTGYQKSLYQLNYWLSLKKLGRWEEVSAEVHEADFSGKSSPLQVAYASLVEDEEYFFDYVKQAVDHPDFGVEFIYKYPIFDYVRQSSDFENRMSEIGLSIE